MRPVERVERMVKMAGATGFTGSAGAVTGKVPAWTAYFNTNPLPALLQPDNAALRYFVRRDLLEEDPGPVEDLWKLPAVTSIIRQQQGDGRWQYSQGQSHLRDQTNYDQLETYRQFGELIEKYGLNCNHPAIQKGAEFLFSFQTGDGDFRGIYGAQYTPNYSAAIMELLVKAGYERDPRIEKGFEWLLSLRQNDGGWTIPFRTHNRNLDVIMTGSTPLQPDRTRPFSHLVTGTVLRAFAAHPVWSRSTEARKAGELLLSRFFERDAYPDRQGVDYWFRFSYPFWFTDLLSALHALAGLGFSSADPNIAKGLDWFKERQQPDGLWKLSIVRGRDKAVKYWLALEICRVLKWLRAAS